MTLRTCARMIPRTMTLDPRKPFLAGHEVIMFPFMLFEKMPNMLGLLLVHTLKETSNERHNAVLC